MPRRNWRRAAVLLVTLSALGSCLHRRQAAAPRAAPPAEPATEEVAGRIARQYEAVSDFKATVLLSAALGPPNGAPIKRYPPIRGYLLFQKPADLRLIGLQPVFGAQVFDLASDGRQFRLSLPSRKRFIIGPNDVRELSANRLENIRPVHLQQALLPQPVDPATETASVEAPGAGAGYTLLLTRNSPGPDRRPARTLWIDSATSHVTREVIFDDAGKVLTDARYSQWLEDEGVIFPRRIEINRPREEYRLVIQIQKIEINHGLSSEMFVLEQPPGTQLEVLSDPGAPPQHVSPLR